jgi:WD40 repeat protein
MTDSIKKTSKLPVSRLVGKWLRPLLRFKISTFLIVISLLACYFAMKFYREPVGVANLGQLRPLDSIAVDIWAIEWSPDRRWLGLVGWETPVEVRETTTLLHLKTIGKGKRIIHFAFSSDPSIVAYAENGTKVEILNTLRGNSIEIETGVPQPEMEFSPDNQFLVTGGYAKSAALWRVSDGALVREYQSDPSPSGLAVEFSPDGTLLAVGNRNDVTKIFETLTGKLLHTLPKDSTHGLAFDPTGQRLAIAYVDGTVAIWNMIDGKLLASLATGAKEIYRVDWSPTGELLAAAGLESDIILWNGKDYSELKRLDAPEWVIGLKFSPDGKQLVAAGGSQSSKADRKVTVYGVGHVLTRILK